MEQRRDWRLSERDKFRAACLLIFVAFLFLALVIEVRAQTDVTNLARAIGRDGQPTYHVELSGESWSEVSKMTWTKLSVGDVCAVTKHFWNVNWRIEACW